MKTQQIKREDLSKLYSQVCESWQKKIAELAIFQTGDIISVDEQLITQAYLEADAKQKNLLNKFFKFTSNKIQDRIKTWTDVLVELNLKNSDVLPFADPQTKEQKSLNALAKIQKISQVLNEGWIPDFTNSNQSKYFPFFKKSGAEWVVAYYNCWTGCACVGFGSYYKTSEIALYAGNQFGDIYNDYLPL